MFFLLRMEAIIRRHWKMEFGGLAGDGVKGDTKGGVTKVEWRKDGDGLFMGVDMRGSLPSDESERCMTVYIPGSILILTTRGVLKVEAEE